MKNRIFQDFIEIKNGRIIAPKNAVTGKWVSDIREMDSLEKKGQVVMEMITTSDTRHFFTTAINDYFMKDDENADMQWEQLFYTMDSKGSGELFPHRNPSTAGSGSHGITFSEVKEGGEIGFSTVESDEKFIKNRKWATAVGFSNEWFEDGSMGLIEMTTKDFKDSANDRMAEIHYGIIIDAVVSGLSHSMPVGGTSLDDLIAAINATVAIMQRNKCRPNYICCAPEQEDVVEHALHDVYRDDTITKSAKRLTALSTEHFGAGTLYVVQAKRWLVSTNRLSLTLGTFQDLLHDSETLVGKFRRGAMLGNGRAVRAITGL